MTLNPERGRKRYCSRYNIARAVESEMTLNPERGRKLVNHLSHNVPPNLSEMTPNPERGRKPPDLQHEVELLLMDFREMTPPTPRGDGYT